MVSSNVTAHFVPWLWEVGEIRSMVYSGGSLFEMGTSTGSVTDRAKINAARAKKSEVKCAWVRVVLEWVRHGVSRMGNLAFLEFTPISVGALDPIRLGILYTDNCNHIYY